jgi:hypothetical protein
MTNIIDWRTALRRAGLPAHWSSRCIGPRDLRELARLRDADPELYAVFERAYEASLAEYLARRGERRPAAC